MIIKDKSIKIGSMPTVRIRFRYNYKIAVGEHVEIKEVHNHGEKYRPGRITEINDVCIFIELF